MLLSMSDAAQAHPQTADAAPARVPDESSSFAILPRFGAIFMQASTSAFTALDRLLEHARSAPLNWISTMRSTPFAPITAGTPT